LYVIRRIGTYPIFVLGLATITASPAIASGGTFSRPVRLPSAPSLVWDFAVNDHGQAVAVEGSEHGALVYPVGRRGHLGKPWRVELPGGFPGGETSVALDSRGRIAVGILYYDKTQEASREYHGGSGCCQRVAVASWRLGAKPPMAQALSPPQDAESGNLHHALQVPLLAMGPTALTALWTTGAEAEFEGRSGGGEVQIEQAFGAYGSPLSTAMVFAAPKGALMPHLSLEPNGDPVASWLDEGDELRTVAGSPTGALQPPARAQRAPKLSDPVGFTSDYEGDTVFSYFSRLSRKTSELRYMTSHDGGLFTRPREVGLTGSEVPVATVVAGGHRTLLAFWGCLGLENSCTQRGKIGKISGTFSKAFTPHGTPEGFIDSSARAVIVYDTDYGLYATTAESGEPLTPSRPFAARLPHYFQLGAEQDEEPPLPTSPNGHAILYFTNGENEQYLVRYTP